MAIVRWGSEPTHGYKSDIYIIELADGSGYRCVGCRLITGGYETAGVKEMLAHVRAHRSEGAAVPLWVFDRLVERAHGIRQPDPVIVELEAQARAAEGWGWVVSDDIDVPADIRLSGEEAIRMAKQFKEAADSGDE